MTVQGLRWEEEGQFFHANVSTISVMFFFQRGLKNSYRTLCLTFHLSGVQKLDPSFRNLHQAWGQGRDKPIPEGADHGQGAEVGGA